MRREFFSLIFVAIFATGIFLFSQNVLAVSIGDVIINEIAWMGSTASSADEWIELKNNTDAVIDLTGWTLSAADGTPEIILIGTIGSQEYFLLERTDDDSATPTADQIYSGAIGNDGEILELRDSDNNLIDIIDGSSGWPVGDNTTKHTMARYLNDWYLSNEVAGTPKADNNIIPPVPVNALPVAEAGPDQNAEINQEVFFNASASTDSDGTISDYFWDFGDNNSATGITLSHTYTQENIFTITLTITDNNGATNTDTLLVTVTNPPAQSISTSTPATIGSVVINEFVADPTSGEKEWIELYNVTTSIIDLASWSIEDGTGKILNLSGQIPAKGFLVFENSSSKLNNAGDIIILKDVTDQIIDQITYGDWDDGDIIDNLPTTSDPNSIARNIDGGNDFSITITPTKNSTNIITSIPQIILDSDPAPKTSSGGGGSGTPPPVSYTKSSVVVNEFVSDPADDDSEWIELYNTTSQIISLNYWKIEDGAENTTNLSGIIYPHDFLVITEPNGNLNNAGDIITLYDPAENIIDQIAYGSWDDGSVSNNPVAPDDFESLARIIDGQDTDNDLNDFSITLYLTKGSSNIIEDDNEKKQSQIQIIINEILPNPEGSDEKEFIEIKNTSPIPIDLTDFYIQDASGKKFILSGNILSENFVVIKKTDSKIALNNSGAESVFIYSSFGELIDEVDYAGKAPEGQSYSRTQDNTWVWTEQLTPGEENKIIIANQVPVAVINIDKEEVDINEKIFFDGSDSFDYQSNQLEYIWDFGDGEISDQVSIYHSYNKEGIYQVILTATDPEGASETASQMIYVGQNAPLTALTVTPIFISEVLPNPEGSDQGEFVELYNAGDYPVDLTGWTIDDIDGGSRPHIIKDKIIPAGAYLSLHRQETNIAFNNDYDSVRLFDKSGELIDQLDYERPIEGSSFALDFSHGFSWTSLPTPGAENIFIIANTGSGGNQSINEIDISQLRELEKGDKVRVQGVVSVEPGILGTQVFYLAGSGVQIYSYKKDFPELKPGDLVEVTGELSESGGETRIKTTTQDDIKILDSLPSPEPHQVTLADVGEDTEGYLIQVEGEVIEIRGSSIYLDDGDDEVRVYIKSTTEIKDLDITEGQTLQVTGIVSQTKSGYRILPRYQSDIITGQIAGAQDFQLIVTGQNQSVLTKYLIAINIFLAVIVIWQIIQQRKIKKQGWQIVEE